jgi:hypothetical protein
MWLSRFSGNLLVLVLPIVGFVSSCGIVASGSGARSSLSNPSGSAVADPSQAPSVVNHIQLSGAFKEDVDATRLTESSGVYCSGQTVDGSQLFTIVVAGNGRSGAYYSVTFDVSGAGTRFKAGEGLPLASQATLQVAANGVHAEDYPSGDAILTMNKTRTTGTIGGTFIGPKGTTQLDVAWSCTPESVGVPVA